MSSHAVALGLMSHIMQHGSNFCSYHSVTAITLSMSSVSQLPPTVLQSLYEFSLFGTLFPGHTLGQSEDSSHAPCDSDNRIRAIAKEVFGLEMVVWNQDTLDLHSTGYHR
ncbi:hypothetical protein C8J56DRAFT_888453 [Mycena floridula]|nr:hypothetical protein C8J56DRAFT_888453 [Mycena floridula]